ncbi:hypothetical protein V6N11_049848 [Hibiscus sabdariffa]|uniref:Uncharacterized protein n=1 Tax=Hibiscus sabdariffa TaxID=183260 RepID=A0ABR2T8G6_9ROSI
MEEVSTKQRVVKSDASSPLLKDRFQAWMQAPIWKSRKVSKSKATNTPETLSHGQIKVAVSRFVMLSDDANDTVPREGDKDHVNAGVGDALFDGGKVVVASKDVVVQEPVTLNVGMHVVVRVVERGSESVSKKGGSHRGISDLSDATTKEWSARGGESSSLGGGKQFMAESVEVQRRENIYFDQSSKYSDERMGGSCQRNGVSVKFGDFMQCSNLNDLGFQGPLFILKRVILHQRLDRYIGNDGWWNMWPNSQLMHLSRLGSDHIPILLVTEPPVAS